jgi:SAM-dependent methyltransferase
MLKNWYEERARKINTLKATYLSKGVSGVFYRYRADKVMSVLVSSLAKEKSKGSSPWMILDIGCGGGYYTKKLQKLGITVGLDFCIAYLRLAKEYCRNAFFVNGDAEHLPFRDGCFNLILCTEVLEHLTNPDNCLKEISRVLSEKGVLIVTSPMKYSLMEIMGRKRDFEHNIQHISVFTFKKFMAKLSSEFIVLKCEAILFIPLHALTRFLWVKPEFISIIDSILSKIKLLRNFSWCVICICRKRMV